MSESDSTPPAAIVVHAIPGRTRLRFADRRHLGAIAARLATHPGVRGATPNARTGSILLLHDGAIEAISADLPIVLLPRPAPTRRQPARLLEFAPRTALNAVALACVLLGAYHVRRGRLFGAALESAWNAFNALRDMKAPSIAAALLAGGAMQAARGHVLSPAASLVYYALSLLRPRGAAEKSG